MIAVAIARVPKFRRLFDDLKKAQLDGVALAILGRLPMHYSSMNSADDCPGLIQYVLITTIDELQEFTGKNQHLKELIAKFQPHDAAAPQHPADQIPKEEHLVPPQNKVLRVVYRGENAWLVPSTPAMAAVLRNGGPKSPRSTYSSNFTQVVMTGDVSLALAFPQATLTKSNCAVRFPFMRELIDGHD
jgi:hypothetical protein